MKTNPGARSLNFAKYVKSNSLELSAPDVGTRKIQGKECLSVSSVPFDSSLCTDVVGAGPATAGLDAAVSSFLE